MKNLNVNVETRESRVLDSLNVMTTAEVQNIIDNRIDGTFETISTIKTEKGRVIDLSNPKNIVRTLARIGYVAGSMVGIITNLVDVATVLMDNEFNKQFLVPGTNKVDMFLLSKVFTNLNTNATGVGYKEIFVNTDASEKIFQARYVDGRVMELVKATKNDIKVFDERISNAGTLYQEDLCKIGRDLEKIGRLMQELEIDSAKKPTVKEGMKEITDFMSAFNCKLASKKVGVYNNFDEIVAAVKYGKNAKEIEFVYNFNEYTALEELPKLIAEYDAKVDAMKDLSDKEKSKMKYKNKMQLLKDSVIIDPAFKLKANMVAQVANDTEKLVNHYKNSNMNIFDPFKVVTIAGKEKAVAELTYFAVLACDMINSHYAYKKNISMTKIEDLAATLRNAIYSLGHSLGLTAEESFRVGVSAGWRKIERFKGERLVASANFKYAAIEAMFTSELKWFFNADAMYSSIEVEIPAGYGVEIDSVLQMEDGACEVTLDNGDIDYITCIDEEDYTGIVIAKVIDGVPMFVKYENPYEYDFIEFIAYDQLCDIYRPENTFLDNATEEVIANACTAATETNTYGFDKARKDLAKEADAKRFEVLMAKWSNFMQLSVADKDTYTLTTNKANNRVYISVRNKVAGKNKALGRMLSGVKTDRISAYNSIDTIVCPAGALTILKK